LKITAGIVLSVLVFLFVHSETDFFDEHNENCKYVDLCLILDNANCDNQHISHHFQKTFTQNYHLPSHSFVQTELKLYQNKFISNDKPINFPDKLFLKNQIILI